MTKILNKNDCKIIISDEAIQTIVYMSLMEIPDAKDLISLNAKKKLPCEFDKNELKKVIKIELVKEQYIISLHLLIKYGIDVKNIADEIQFKIINNINLMAGLKNFIVHIFVDKLFFDKQTKFD